MAAFNKEKGKCEFQWNLIPKELKLCRKSAAGVSFVCQGFKQDLLFFIYIKNIEKGATNIAWLGVRTAKFVLLLIF